MRSQAERATLRLKLEEVRSRETHRHRVHLIRSHDVNQHHHGRERDDAPRVIQREQDVVVDCVAVGPVACGRATKE